MWRPRNPALRRLGTRELSTKPMKMVQAPLNAGVLTMFYRETATPSAVLHRVLAAMMDCRKNQMMNLASCRAIIIEEEKFMYAAYPVKKKVLNKGDVQALNDLNETYKLKVRNRSIWSMNYEEGQRILELIDAQAQRVDSAIQQRG